MRSVYVIFPDGKTPEVKFQGAWTRRDVDRTYKIMLNNLMKYMRTFKIAKPKISLPVKDQLTKKLKI